MKNLFLSLILVTLVNGSTEAQSRIICDSHLQSISPSFQYSVPTQIAVKKQAVVVDTHVAEAKHVQNDQVIDALGIIATQAQQYQAMIAGLQSLGFAGNQCPPQSYQACTQPNQQVYMPQQNYVPFVQAPYQAGTTAYGVRNVQVDAFGPQDVREIMASVSRYSTQANTGANQLMGQANSLADRIAQSVASDADAALRVATIDAETRGAATTSQALIAMAQVMGRTLAETRPQQQTRINLQEEITGPNPLPTMPAQDGSYGPIDNPNPQQESVFLREYCIECHGPDLAEPKGQFRLGALTEVEIDTAILQVYEGKMPPNKSLPATQREALALELRSLLN